tara:strand:- start:3062 stop:4456 length:1395 start_codon:yes stop_codon:yes gene_type:complete
MPFNAANQYSATHKAWDQVGNIIPDIEHSEGERPSFEFQVAKWLPVQFFDKHYANWNVIMPGKGVALDQDGYLMPAEFAAGIAAATTVVYSAQDVTAGTIDIATGEAVTVAKTVTLTQLDGSQGGTWSAATAGVGDTSGFMGKFGEAWGPADYAIGVAPYAYLQNAFQAGTNDYANPANLKEHNYKMQEICAVLCDYVIKLPLVPGVATTEAINAVWIGSAMTFGTNAGWHNITQILATPRYDATDGVFPAVATYEVAAYPLDFLPMARNTARTTLVCADTTLLVNERSAMSALTAVGDYWVDYDVGVVFVYSAGGTTLPITGATTLTYYHYAAAVATTSAFGCVLSTTTELIPGDFVGITSGSNWIRLNTPGPAQTTANFANALGQVLGFLVEPRDALDRVKTAYDSLRTDASGTMANAAAGSASVNLGQMDQMPGSATGGVSDATHYAGGANLLVVINLINR